VYYNGFNEANKEVAAQIEESRNEKRAPYKLQSLEQKAIVGKYIRS